MAYKLVAALLFILSGTHDPVKDQVIGTWKGAYGTENNIIEFTVQVSTNNKATLTQTTGDFTAAGNYKLQGDTAILFKLTLDNKKEKEFQMQGRFNRTITFIDGEWNSNNGRGCFFLQKFNASSQKRLF